MWLSLAPSDTRSKWSLRLHAMQLDTSSIPGRRRVNQLTTEQWREALQQQLLEKERLRQRPKAGLTDEEQPRQSNNRIDHHEQEQLNETNQNQDGPSSSQRGRRAVRGISKEEWKASLEEQIRQRQQQQSNERSATAPATSDNVASGNTGRVVSTAEASASSLPMDSSSSQVTTAVGGRRRITAVQQTREEYLRGLQEQIELKKKQEADQPSNRTRHRRRLADDDEEPASIAQANQPSDQTSTAACITASSDDPVQAVCSSEQATPPSITKEPHVDPVALEKLFELCEGMKQQNEELKLQLRHQQDMLATLAMTKAGATEKPQAEGDRKSESKVLARSKKEQVSVKKPQPAKAQQATISTPNKRGITIKTKTDPVRSPKPQPPGVLPADNHHRSRLPKPRIDPRKLSNRLPSSPPLDVTPSVELPNAETTLGGTSQVENLHPDDKGEDSRPPPPPNEEAHSMKETVSSVVLPVIGSTRPKPQRLEAARTTGTPARLPSIQRPGSSSLHRDEPEDDQELQSTSTSILEGVSTFVPLD